MDKNLINFFFKKLKFEIVFEFFWTFAHKIIKKKQTKNKKKHFYLWMKNKIRLEIESFAKSLSYKNTFCSIKKPVSVICVGNVGLFGVAGIRILHQFIGAQCSCKPPLYLDPLKQWQARETSCQNIGALDDRLWQIHSSSRVGSTHWERIFN